MEQERRGAASRRRGHRSSPLRRHCRAEARTPERRSRIACRRSRAGEERRRRGRDRKWVARVTQAAGVLLTRRRDALYGLRAGAVPRLTWAGLVPAPRAHMAAQARHRHRAGLARARRPSSQAGLSPCLGVPGAGLHHGPARFGHVYM